MLDGQIRECVKSYFLNAWRMVNLLQVLKELFEESFTARGDLNSCKMFRKEIHEHHSWF